MKKLLINTNELKLIAILAMIIDHIGYYFEPYIQTNIYVIMRIIGRIAMPIFVFLIVNGFFNTKNLKRYIQRLSRLAIYTQVIITVLAIINIKFFPDYSIEIYRKLNIVFSFILILIVIYMLENILKKTKVSFSLFIISLITCIYVLIPIDYGIMCLLLSIVYYACFKIKINIDIKNRMYIYNTIITVGIWMISVIFSLENPLYLFSCLSIPVILLYNFEIGIKSLKLQRLFYSIFPIQHFILYIIAMLSTKLLIM